MNGLLKQERRQRQKARYEGLEGEEIREECHGAMRRVAAVLEQTSRKKCTVEVAQLLRKDSGRGLLLDNGSDLRAGQQGSAREVCQTADEVLAVLQRQGQDAGTGTFPGVPRTALTENQVRGNYRARVERSERKRENK